MRPRPQVKDTVKGLQAGEGSGARPPTVLGLGRCSKQGRDFTKIKGCGTACGPSGAVVGQSASRRSGTGERRGPRTRLAMMEREDGMDSTVF